MTPEDAATLYPAIRKECDGLEQRLCDLIKARENAGRLNSDWQAVADQQRGEIEELRRERDELMRRVMELERRHENVG
jgi:Cdc6-like AAA superfamily ATPase